MSLQQEAALQATAQPAGLVPGRLAAGPAARALPAVQLRLVGGGSDGQSGRLEILIDNKWGTVW